MNKICTGAKIGLLIQITSLIIMEIFVIVSKPIPDVFVWLFNTGLVIVLASSLMELRKKSKLS